MIHVSETLEVGTFADIEIADAMGPDLIAVGASLSSKELLDDAR